MKKINLRKLNIILFIIQFVLFFILLDKMDHLECLLHNFQDHLEKHKAVLSKPSNLNELDKNLTIIKIKSSYVFSFLLFIYLFLNVYFSEHLYSFLYIDEVLDEGIFYNIRNEIYSSWLANVQSAPKLQSYEVETHDLENELFGANNFEKYY